MLLLVYSLWLRTKGEATSKRDSKCKQYPLLSSAAPSPFLHNLSKSSRTFQSNTASQHSQNRSQSLKSSWMFMYRISRCKYGERINHFKRTDIFQNQSRLTTKIRKASQKNKKQSFHRKIKDIAFNKNAHDKLFTSEQQQTYKYYERNKQNPCHFLTKSRKYAVTLKRSAKRTKQKPKDSRPSLGSRSWRLLCVQSSVCLCSQHRLVTCQLRSRRSSMTLHY